MDGSLFKVGLQRLSDKVRVAYERELGKVVEEAKANPWVLHKLRFELRYGLSDFEFDMQAHGNDVCELVTYVLSDGTRVHVATPEFGVLKVDETQLALNMARDLRLGE